MDGHWRELGGDSCGDGNSLRRRCVTRAPSSAFNRSPSIPTALQRSCPSVCEDVATAFVAKCTEKAARKCKQDAACIREGRVEVHSEGRQDRGALPGAPRPPGVLMQPRGCHVPRERAREQCETRGTDLVAARTRSASAIAKPAATSRSCRFPTLASRAPLYLQALDEACAGVGDRATPTSPTTAGAALLITTSATSPIWRRASSRARWISRRPGSRVGPTGGLRRAVRRTGGRTVDASLRIAAPLPRTERSSSEVSTKFVRVIRRPRARVIRVLRNGPGRRRSRARDVACVSLARRRASRSVHSRIPFRYGRPNRSRAAEDPPVLIVSVQREDVQLTDHFEIALDAIDQERPRSTTSSRYWWKSAARFRDALSPWPSLPASTMR